MKQLLVFSINPNSTAAVLRPACMQRNNYLHVQLCYNNIIEEYYRHAQSARITKRIVVGYS